MGSSVDSLHCAAFRGDGESVKRLLRKHDVSERGDQGGCTPLHAAAASLADGAPEVISVLLDHGADPNSTTGNGATALHVAAVTGNILTVQRLLQCPDVRVDAVIPGSGFSALHLGVASADEKTVSALIKHQGPLEQSDHSGVTPVHIAAHLGLPDILNQLLILFKHAPKHGPISPLLFTCCAPRGDVVKPSLHVLTCVDWLGPIPVKAFLLRALMLSAEERQLSDFVPPRSLHSSFVASSVRTLQNAVKQKLEMFELPPDTEEASHAHARNNSRPESGFQAILACLGCGRARTSPSAHRWKDETATTSSSSPGRSMLTIPESAKHDLQRISALKPNRFYECAEQLLNWGCDLDERMEEQQTPLMLAAQAMDLPLVQLLIKRGADVHAQDKQGQSVLHWSAMSEGPWSDEAVTACKTIIGVIVDARVSV
eukprot:jgi/Ulvmu1/7535/UM037_0079.1